jgi:hypothetical protein
MWPPVVVAGVIDADDGLPLRRVDAWPVPELLLETVKELRRGSCSCLRDKRTTGNDDQPGVARGAQRAYRSGHDRFECGLQFGVLYVQGSSQDVEGSEGLIAELA